MPRCGLLDGQPLRKRMRRKQPGFISFHQRNAATQQACGLQAAPGALTASTSVPATAVAVPAAQIGSATGTVAVDVVSDAPATVVSDAMAQALAMPTQTPAARLRRYLAIKHAGGVA